MRVLFVASEAAPWVKVGGLGDVVGSLPRVLRERGVDARICLPAHAGVRSRAPDATSVARFTVAHADGPMRVEVFETELDGVPAYLVSGPTIPADGIVYTGRMDEEGARYVLFSLAAVELCRRLEWRPDVLHCHDWHAAVAAWQMGRVRAEDPGLASIATLLTIHNLPYSGDGAQEALRAFGVEGTDDARLPEGRREVPLALGLVAADGLSTVSEGYAREMLEPEHGHGFEALLRDRREDLTGIRNGLDVARWDPETDRELASPYGVGSLDRRDACRDALRRELGIRSEAPLIAMVSRFVPQKGIDLALGALRRLGPSVEAVLLGTGEPELERAALALAAEAPERVRAFVAFDEGLARRLYAGADLLLVPSRYEPCGVAQMIAMRYGCVPVARETGGLADTVRDVELSGRPTGVLFPDATASSLAFGIRRALARRAHRDSWRAVQIAGMSEDFSWHRSAGEYVHLYERLGSRRVRGVA